MRAEPPLLHTFETAFPCRYLVQAPGQVGPGALLVLTLHGYGSNPETMLRLTAAMTPADHVSVSLQAPHPFYLEPDNFESPVGYGWGTRNDMPAAIALHHRMVRSVLELAGQRYGIGPERRVLAGFSQPVSMNYRFAAAFPELLRGVIGICGGVPREWDSGAAPLLEAAVLHIARMEDPIYPREQVSRIERVLRFQAANVSFHLLPGGHRVPSQAGAIVGPWLERVFGGSAAAPAG